MIRTGVIERLLLGFIALIFLAVQQFEAVPLPASYLEAILSPPAVRAARQVHGDAKTSIQKPGGIFKVFPSKNRVELRPHSVVPVAPLGHTRSPRRRPTAGRRFLEGPLPRAGPGSSSGSDSASGSGSPSGSDSGSDSGSPSGAGHAGSGGKKNTNAQGEIIVTYKSYQTNARGEVIQQQVTFESGPYEKLDKDPKKVYFPSVNLSTVCPNKSTIYNEFKVERWLSRGLSRKKKSSRPFLIKLRRELYDKGQSELCHTMNYTDWQKYQDCAIRRNQRMEYLIPNYPQQQAVHN